MGGVTLFDGCVVGDSADGSGFSTLWTCDGAFEVDVLLELACLGAESSGKRYD